MKTNSTTLCYILPKGATQEESCTWQDLRKRIESGELTSDTLIYNEESQQWVTIASLSEFADVLASAADRSGETDARIDEEDLSELREEYERAAREARDQFDSFECITRAARLALSLDMQDEAIDYYQRALELQPFNKPLAAEIKRSFSPVVYRNFSLLDRQSPFWEDPIAALMYPLQIGVFPFAIAAAVLTTLSLVPYAQPLYWIVLTLFAVRVTCEAGKKSISSPNGILNDFESFFVDWKPFASFIVSGMVFLLPFAFLSELMLLLERPGHWNFFVYIQDSPLMTVALFLTGAVLLPGALAMSTNKRQKLFEISMLKRIMKMITSDDWEYVLLLVGITAVTLAWVGLRALFAFIPVIGDSIAAAGALYGVVLIGYMTGRTRSRLEHLFPK